MNLTYWQILKLLFLSIYSLCPFSLFLHLAEQPMTCSSYCQYCAIGENQKRGKKTPMRCMFVILVCSYRCITSSSNNNSNNHSYNIQTENHIGCPENIIHIIDTIQKCFLSIREQETWILDLSLYNTVVIPCH